MADDPSGLIIFECAGTLLRYSVLIFTVRDEVHISGDPEVPFGTDSFFEIGVFCNAIRVIPDPYYKHQQGLRFWYGDPDDPENVRMTIYKRPDGDLKVWRRQGEGRHVPPLERVDATIRVH
jgi:hypothetical protein